MNMKKKIFTAAIAAAVASVTVVSGSLAYFTAKDEVDPNVFTFGNVAIELTEDKWVTPETVIPGATYEKDPTVKNTGSEEAYARIKVTVSDAAAFKAALGEDYDLSKIFIGHDEALWERTGITLNADDTLTYEYTLKGTLEKDESATLFTAVQVPAEFDEKDVEALQGAFEINIAAEAVQANGFETAADAFSATFDKE